jgi:hypothetical protein
MGRVLGAGLEQRLCATLLAASDLRRVVVAHKDLGAGVSAKDQRCVPPDTPAKHTAAKHREALVEARSARELTCLEGGTTAELAHRCRRRHGPRPRAIVAA